MRVHFHLPAASIVLWAMLAAQTPVWGQTRTMFSGGTTTGGSLTTSSRSMAGGTGTSGGGSLGTIGTTGNSITTLSSGIGQITGSESFIRGNQQAGSFVGASSSEMGGVVGAVQAGQTGRQTGSGLRTGSSLSGSGLSGSGLSATGRSRTSRSTTARTNRTGVAGVGAGGRRSTSTEIRATLQVAFTRPAAVSGPAQISNRLVQRLSRSPRVQALSPVEVLVQGQIATLQGVVATDYDRALAAQIALLEPGILQVRNELVVEAPPAEPPMAAPATPAVEPPTAP